MNEEDVMCVFGEWCGEKGVKGYGVGNIYLGSILTRIMMGEELSRDEVRDMLDKKHKLIIEGR